MDELKGSLLLINQFTLPSDEVIFLQWKFYSDILLFFNDGIGITF